jgi:hypothetical protein
MRAGIDIIVGKPLTAKSFLNSNDMPKFYSTTDAKTYTVNPEFTKSEQNNNLTNTDMYSIDSSYGTNPINTIYFKTDTYDTKHKFTSTQTETPKFDMSSSYDNIKFNHQIKE